MQREPATVQVDEVVSDGPETVGPGALTSRRRQIGEFFFNYGIFVVLAALVVIASTVYNGFLEPANLALVISQNAALGIVAVGMTFAIIGGGFDLSVGAIYAASATTFAALSLSHPLWLAGGAALAVGALFGTVNGVVITAFRVNPFIATLGTSSLIAGVVLIISGSQPYNNITEEFGALGNGQVLGVPYPVIILIAVFLLASILLNWTSWGRGVFSVGSNIEASRLSGLRVNAIRGSTYLATGLLSAVAALITSSQLGVGQGSMGATLALDAVAVVVIGGTSLTGGEGRLWRTAVGLALLAVVNNIFISLAVDSNYQLITKGFILIAAVAIDSLLRRR